MCTLLLLAAGLQSEMSRKCQLRCIFRAGQCSNNLLSPCHDYLGLLLPSYSAQLYCAHLTSPAPCRWPITSSTQASTSSGTSGEQCCRRGRRCRPRRRGGSRSRGSGGGSELGAGLGEEVTAKGRCTKHVVLLEWQEPASPW